jgi:hypothetical protein
MSKKRLARFILIVGLALGTMAAFGPVGHSAPGHALADAATGTVKWFND